MTLSDWANISQMFEALLVMISLGFIWYQLREGTKLSKAANTQSLAEHAASFNALLIQNADIAALWYSYGRGLDALDATNTYRYREMLLQWLIFHENIFYQWRKHLLEDEIYDSWFADLKYTVTHHDLNVIASDIATVFPGAFGSHVTKLMNEGKFKKLSERASGAR